MYTFFDPNRGEFSLDSVLAASLGAGNSFFVNETTGLDTNSGSKTNPLKTLSAALALCTADHNDVVYFTGSIHLTATLTWNKNGVSLVGLKPPSSNGRSRISSTGSTVFTPLVDVTAQGCLFANFATFHGYNSNSAQICWKDEGGRNCYKDVQFFGGGHATAAAHAGMRSLLISGSTGENTFDRCTFGLDTVVRATNANTSVEFSGGSPRNVFRDCIFQMDSSLAGNSHVTVDSDGIDRYVFFDRCTFINAQYGGPAATALTACIVGNASAGGVILLREPISVGSGKIAATGQCVWATGNVPTAGTSGLAVAVS